VQNNNYNYYIHTNEKRVQVHNNVNKKGFYVEESFNISQKV